MYLFILFWKQKPYAVLIVFPKSRPFTSTAALVFRGLMEMIGRRSIPVIPGTRAFLRTSMDFCENKK